MSIYENHLKLQYTFDIAVNYLKHIVICMVFFKLLKILQHEARLLFDRWGTKKFWGKIFRNLSKITEFEKSV